jgi:hypothetical protein
MPSATRSPAKNVRPEYQQYAERHGQNPQQDCWKAPDVPSGRKTLHADANLLPIDNDAARRKLEDAERNRPRAPIRDRDGNAYDEAQAEEDPL